jgi:hypothetical protein
MGPQSQHSGEMGTASAQEEIYHEDDTTETNTLTSEGTEVSSQQKRLRSDLRVWSKASCCREGYP